MLSWYLRTITLCITALLALIPLFHTSYNLWIKEKHITPFKTKILVTLSMLLFFTNVCDHTIFRLIQWIPGGLGINDEICVANVWILSTSYYIGKAMMYSFFIIRAVDIFKLTSVPYKPCISWIVLFIIIFISILLTITWPLLDTSLIRSTIIQSTQGRMCEISTASSNDYGSRHNDDYNYNRYVYQHLILYDLYIGTIIDIIFSLITAWMLIGKLFYLSNNSLSMKRKEFEMNNSISIDVKLFHTMTIHENKVLLLSGKLLILLIVEILSAQITVILFLTLFDGIYAIDSCLNIFILWLAFRFSDKYFKKMFAGNYCIKSCFPVLKMIAVGCICDDQSNKCCCTESQYGEYYKLSKEEYQVYIMNRNKNIYKNTSVQMEMAGSGQEKLATPLLE